ncbi:hypothetical protein FE257_008527 [Aspergillus nanangensis]|uniref:Oxidoreductase, short-chain dehydrogenase/reductase family n=1 Tax=Aspergillus nanangensis TaxID=2582783 RepID=A0AAD4GTF9_ASPNN|nr:hypothetical protein FE257_008527 [Aspergillus nanangensis]
MTVSQLQSSGSSSRLQGQVAVITGGASGFGKGIATRFQREGAKVLITDISSEAGEKTAKEIGCGFLKADVTKREDWERILQLAINAYGGLTTIVNNAGTSYPNKATETVSTEEYQKTFDVNVLSIFLSTSVLVPYFLETKTQGCFITIGSTGGIRPRPGLVWYNSSKAAAMHATKNMALEYGSRGIRFNSVCPIFCGSTGLSSTFMGMEANDDNRKQFSSVIPLGREATPEDVASSCLYLASEDGQFINGTDLVVDGGRCV